MIVVRPFTVPSHPAIFLPTKIAMYNDNRKTPTTHREPVNTDTSRSDTVEEQRLVITRLTLNMRAGGSPEPDGNRGPEEYGKAADVSI